MVNARRFGGFAVLLLSAWLAALLSERAGWLTEEYHFWRLLGLGLLVASIKGFVRWAVDPESRT